jgi:glycerol uptake facilitator-like aquaporin
VSAPLHRALLAEALGSAALLAGVVGSGIMGVQLSQGNDAIALLANAVATAALLVVLISALGPISGAHFNPAVSLVMALRGELPWSRFAAYVPAQALGAIAGVLLAHAMFELALWQPGTRVRSGGAQWISEGVATFGLVLTILLAQRHRPSAIPALVAGYILAAYWFTASTSFANPAVTLARSLTQSFAGIAPGDVTGFVIAQLAGALLALPAAAALLGRDQSLSGTPGTPQQSAR